MNIIEDYVSFETANLLKEKGFDARCPTIYTAEGELLYTDVKHRNMYAVTNRQLECYTDIIAPTLQITMKWLREVQNLFVFPFPQVNTNKFWVEIYQLSDNQEWENLYCKSIDLQDYPTYEQACEAAIKYCLENLI